MEGKKYTESVKNFFESKTASKILIGLGICVVALGIFQAGMFVGFHKASFGRNWDNHYYENFGPRGEKGMMPRPGQQFPNAHGAAGKIIKIESPNIIVEDHDATEKIIVLKDDTKILKMNTEIARDQLAVDDFLIVIGSPNEQGQIEAKFIRVLTTPPTQSTKQQ